MKVILLIALIAVFNLFSQFRNPVEQTDPRIKLMSSSQGSIFDMSKVSLSHSFSMNYLSSGSNSIMLNEYVAGLKYQISDPLTLRLNLGMAYTPYSSFTSVEDNNADIYLKSASLDYKPNDSFRMRIDFRNIKPGDYLNNPGFGASNYFKEDE